MILWKTIKGALLSEAEREWLLNTARSISETFESPLLLNIGIWHGASMHCLRAGAPGATLVGIDVATRELLGSDVLRAELIWKDSRTVAWDRPIHLLFVDGGHAYDVVRSDITKFGQHVVVGGIMAFHDYHRSKTYLEKRARRHPKRSALGVQRAVDEFCTKARGWEVLATIDSIKAFRREK
jgi:hypothetical protein